MPASVNSATLIGNLGTDPEASYTQSGKLVVKLSVATNERWSSKDGQTQQKTEWHRVIVWGQAAEFSQNFLKKGHQVYVEGRIQYRSWENQNGQRQYATEIVANKVLSLESRRPDEPRNEAPPPQRQSQAQSRPPQGGYGGGQQGGYGGHPPANTFDNDDDIPFR